MKILIIYSTSEGHTRKIARFMEDFLQEKDHQVVIADVTDEPPSPDKYDCVLIGGSIHMHKYQNALRDYIKSHLHELSKKNGAFFSISMAIASGIEEEQDDVRSITDRFLVQTGWKPTERFYFAGALRYTKYDYFKKLIMRMIAAKQGGSTDTSKDHEYTDWERVKSSVLKFVDNCN